jgi:hypothetical protein
MTSRFIGGAWGSVSLLFFYTPTRSGSVYGRREGGTKAEFNQQWPGTYAWDYRYRISIARGLEHCVPVGILESYSNAVRGRQSIQDSEHWLREHSCILKAGPI